jgi:hypothetical protein
MAIDLGSAHVVGETLAGAILHDVAGMVAISADAASTRLLPQDRP